MDLIFADIVSLVASSSVVQEGDSLNITCVSVFGISDLLELRLITGPIFASTGTRVSVSIVNSNTARFTIDPVISEDNGQLVRCSFVGFFSDAFTITVVSSGN